MRMFDSRTEGDHIHTRVVATNDTALQAGVDDHDARLGLELTLVDCLHRVHDTAVDVRLPAGIIARERYIGTCYGECRVNDLAQFALAALYCRTGQALHLDHGLLALPAELDHRQVVGGLNYIRHLGHHAEYSVRAYRNGVNQIILHLFGHLGFRAVNLLGSQADCVLYAFEFGYEQSLIIIHQVH